MLTSCGGTELQNSPAAVVQYSATVDSLVQAAQHYWDNLNTTDTTNNSLKEKFIAYTEHLKAIPAESASQAVRQWMKQMEEHPRLSMKFHQLALEVLYESNSPLLNEALYIPFAESGLEYSRLSELGKMQFTHRLTVARKNNPGSIAGDFAYTTPDGKETTLHRTEGEQIMILFYNPECDNCKATIARLHNDTTIARLTAQKRLQPLMIYTEGNDEVWHNNKNNHPQGWLSGYDKSENISNRRIYELRAMPVIYLLDSNKRVILKNTTQKMLIAHFTKQHP